MMLSVQYIIGQLNSPVEQIMNFIYQWQDVSISLERMSEIHKKDNEENKGRHLMILNQIDKDICVKEMSFHYNGPFPKRCLITLI